jgi:hypothetical protein
VSGRAPGSGSEREAEKLTVPHYHVAFTLPAPIGALAFANKTVVYNLLFRAAAETLTTIAADPKHLGRAHRLHRCAAHLGLGADPSSACPCYRSRRRPVAGRIALDHLNRPDNRQCHRRAKEEKCRREVRRRPYSMPIRISNDRNRRKD